jgi:hypothetical protein
MGKIDEMIPEWPRGFYACIDGKPARGPYKNQETAEAIREQLSREHSMVASNLFTVEFIDKPRAEFWNE